MRCFSVHNVCEPEKDGPDEGYPEKCLFGHHKVVPITFLKAEYCYGGWDGTKGVCDGEDEDSGVEITAEATFLKFAHICLIL